MIREAAAMADIGQVALLGCGNCADIPFGFLSDKFDHLDLVDIDGDALRYAALTALQFDSDLRNYEFHVDDLTGLVDRLEEKALAIVAEEPTALGCLEQLGKELTSTPPAFWRPGNASRYRLILCSGVLTQLQATIRESMEDIFLARHRDGQRLLCRHPGWTTSVWAFARKIEQAFLEHLDTLCACESIIYLQDTVHVSWLTQVDPRHLSASGAWIATRTSSLADYVDDKERILSQRSWDWIRPGQTDDLWGRLYGVQGLIYRGQDKHKKLDA